MIHFIAYDKNTGTRKIRDYLRDNNVKYNYVNTKTEVISRELFMKLLTAAGDTDLIIKDISRTKEEVSSVVVDLENLKISQLYEKIVECPRLLRNPIYFDDVTNKLVVGFSKDSTINLIATREERKRKRESILMKVRYNEEFKYQN